MARIISQRSNDLVTAYFTYLSNNDEVGQLLICLLHSRLLPKSCQIKQLLVVFFFFLYFVTRCLFSFILFVSVGLGVTAPP